MSYYFADQKWPQIAKAVEKNALIILPVGTTEEHGKHLPLSTDAVIAENAARGIADALKDEIPLLVLPTVWYGYSQKEMTRWPGTIRIRTRVMIDIIYDICSSVIEMGFRKLAILDCHGHHSGILNVAVRELADSHEASIAVLSPATLSAERYSQIRKSAPGGSIHGGEWETSLMLHFGEPVDMSQATDEDIFDYHSEFIPGDNFVGGKKAFWSTWDIQKSKTGIYGDPTPASAETGREIMSAVVENAARFLREFYARGITSNK